MFPKSKQPYKNHCIETTETGFCYYYCIQFLWITKYWKKLVSLVSMLMEFCLLRIGKVKHFSNIREASSHVGDVDA